MAILEEFVAEQIGESMIFLVEGEDGGVGSACNRVNPSSLDFGMEILTRIDLFLDFLLAVSEDERFGPIEIQHQYIA